VAGETYTERIAQFVLLLASAIVAPLLVGAYFIGSRRRGGTPTGTPATLKATTISGASVGRGRTSRLAAGECLYDRPVVVTTLVFLIGLRRSARVGSAARHRSAVRRRMRRPRAGHRLGVPPPIWFRCVDALRAVWCPLCATYLPGSYTRL
jgi:hypothetical protein